MGLTKIWGHSGMDRCNIDPIKGYFLSTDAVSQ